MIEWVKVRSSAVLCCAVELRDRQKEEREMLWVMAGDNRRHLEQSHVSGTLLIILFSSSVRVREV